MKAYKTSTKSGIKNHKNKQTKQQKPHARTHKKTRTQNKQTKNKKPTPKPHNLIYISSQNLEMFLYIWQNEIPEDLTFFK